MTPRDDSIVAAIVRSSMFVKSLGVTSEPLAGRSMQPKSLSQSLSHPNGLTAVHCALAARTPSRGSRGRLKVHVCHELRRLAAHEVSQRLPCAKQ